MPGSLTDRIRLMSAQLKSQIANLQRKLAKVELNGSNQAASSSGAKRERKRRRRAPSGVNSNGVGPYGAPMAQNPNPRKPGGNLSLNNAGCVTLTRTEFVREVKGGDDFWSVHSSSVAFLKRLAKLFDRIIWKNVVVHWKPGVGTTEAGLMAYGVDWDSTSTANPSKSVVAALTPIAEGPVWQMTNMRLPPGRLMTKKEYRIIENPNTDETFYQQPGLIIYSCSGDKTKIMGEFWMTYSVELYGTAQE